MGAFAPPDIFAAVAVAARSDPDLPDGVHLRLMPSPALGFPIAPFGIYRVGAYVTEPQLLWRDGRGNVLPQPALALAGGLLIADIQPPPMEDDAVDVAVEVLTDGHFEGTVALIDRVGNRVFSQRSRAPFIVGGPRVDRVRITGRGGIAAVRTWRVYPRRALEPMLGQEPLALLSLPIDGSRPWYAKGLGPGAALDQVKRGAARRLQRPDRPDGPFDALTAGDDVIRVSAHAPTIVDTCERMLADPATVPRQQRFSQEVPATPAGPKQLVDLGMADSLLVQAMDPGIGRYLGLVGALDDRVDGSEPIAYIAIGLFVYDPGATAPDGRSFSASIGTPQAYVERIAEAFADRVGAREIVRRVAAAGQRVEWLAYFARRVHRLEVHGLMAVAGAVPPPDPPALPAPSLGASRWLDGQGRPSTAFRQDFLVPSAPLGPLVALGRLDGGTWSTRHRTIDLPAPANPSRRALAMLLGRTLPKPRTAGLIRILASYARRGLISDSPIPASDAPARYRVALADLFGRFGPPTELDVATPARPAPPTPAPQPHLVLDGPDGVGGGPASPGHVDVEVAVPSVAALAAGSLDIAALELSFDGVPLPTIPVAPVPAGTTTTVTGRIDLPPLTVATARRGTLTAVFVDSAGAPSAPAELAIAYGDRRRPFVVPTGLGLIWTSRPGPSPEVELKLGWPGAAGTRYRVYLADEKGLGLAGATRAEIAVVGGQRDRARTLGGRDRFRLLTEPPLEPRPDGRVRLDERLPRSLATVQFVRVVPLTAQGREAEFESCGVVPVAVPTDRRPPPPRLHVQVDAETRVATVTIAAIGLDLVELQAAEPGLFTDPPGGATRAPEFRLRRASGLVSDPVYAREIARGPLVARRDGATVVFTAEVEDPAPLVPFVRYSYWAEVRMPPERRLALGLVEIPPAGGVGPVIPAQVADMPRPFSLTSAPVTTLHAPLPPVPTVEGVAATVIADPGAVRASLAAPSTPATSARAVGLYRLRIWEQWGDGAITTAGPDVELDGGALTWEGAPGANADRPRPVTLRIAVIDPLGRQGPLFTVTAP